VTAKDGRTHPPLPHAPDPPLVIAAGT
jgi:hypothetical protein